MAKKTKTIPFFEINVEKIAKKQRKTKIYRVLQLKFIKGYM